MVLHPPECFFSPSDHLLYLSVSPLSLSAALLAPSRSKSVVRAKWCSPPILRPSQIVSYSSLIDFRPATHQNPFPSDWEVTTKHVHFEWDIDWKQRRLLGSATHSLISKMDVPSEAMWVSFFCVTVRAAPPIITFWSLIFTFMVFDLCGHG